MVGAFFAILRVFLRLLISLLIADLDLAHNRIEFCLLLRRPVCHLVLLLLERFTKVLGGLGTEGLGTTPLL